MDLAALTAAQAAHEIRSGRVSSTELVEVLLEGIEATDGALKAWALVDKDAAMAAARDADSARARGNNPPLLGVPFGVKDVIDVRDLPTSAAFTPFRDRLPRDDSAVVGRLREAGAIVLGKTVTTQFAHADPPPTRNPWRADRTPGGSSSGSAAAVAALQVPFALGTQTGGSVVRPAYFCGAVGFKPSRDMICRRGVIPLSWSLDHVGIIARSVTDIALILGAATRRPSAPTRQDPPRLGFLSTAVKSADACVGEAVQAMADQLRAAGASVQEAGLQWPWELATATHHVIMQAEAAEAHRDLLAQHPDSYAPILRAYLEVGMAIGAADYVRARRVQAMLRRDLTELAGSFDALLLPSSSTQAPDASSTGDSALQAPFSLTGVPSMTIPSGLSDEGLPHGIQLVGLTGHDEALLAVAAWCESVLPAPSWPSLPRNRAMR